MSFIHYKIKSVNICVKWLKWIVLAIHCLFRNDKLGSSYMMDLIELHYFILQTKVHFIHSCNSPFFSTLFVSALWEKSHLTPTILYWAHCILFKYMLTHTFCKYNACIVLYYDNISIYERIVNKSMYTQIRLQNGGRNAPVRHTHCG